MKTIHLFLYLISISFMLSCSEIGTNTEVSGISSDDHAIFELLPETQHQIRFNNLINENDAINYLAHEAMFDGAGVGIGDFNNDGLPDVFFCGNMVSDQLYLNKGNFEFQDITQKAGLESGSLWSTGVAIGDVNGDGWEDIYVCRFFYVDNDDKRKNILYINNGDLTFSDQTDQYLVGDKGHTIAAAFLDYDLDGDLDLFTANQPPNDKDSKALFKNKKVFQFTDRLFRNDNKVFTDVTSPAGITNFGYALSVSIGDLNNDGYPDIYVANDYEEPDNFFQNNKNGTFTDISHQALRHMSNFAMGSDIADFNNDGWLDIYTVDMVASDNFRLKTNMSGMNPKRFFDLVNAGYHYQYMFNALQFNNGNGLFSDVAQMVGVSNTDWSWSCLLADFDNDGFKDLYVTNSQPRDVRNNDWLIKSKTFMQDKLKEAQEKGIKRMGVSPIELLDLAPSIKLKNHIYKNSGGFEFNRMSDTWGISEEAWSYGAAYADLDNDGDQDLIVNNINDKAFVYRNNSSDDRLNNYLRIIPTGKNGKPVLGTKANIYYQGQRQLIELFTSKGYMSAMEPVIHFGLGSVQQVDSVIVRFPSGKTVKKYNVKANRELKIEEKDADQTSRPDFATAKKKFIELAPVAGNTLAHKENEFDDYEREILLPYKMSCLGPVLASADVNGDNLEDIYIGGSKGEPGRLIIQTQDNQFESRTISAFISDANSEDLGALFFDANGDGAVDLYVSSGGNEYDENAKELRDRLYINNGQGDFEKAVDAIPVNRISSGAVKGSDFDKDGDIDLFVCGRQVPGKYGINARSVLLENNQGKFSDVSSKYFKEGTEFGMATDAVWADVDGDQDDDLIVVGEWMPITLFINEKGSFINSTESFGLKHTNGWWNTIEAVDVDGDGDQDFVAGNLGLNIKYKASKTEPFKVYVSDFDQNGTHDVYLGYHENGICYPVRGRQCSSQQMPFVKEEFPNYATFAKATIEEVLKERANNAVLKEAFTFESVIIINNQTNFELMPLPKPVQISPVFSIIKSDFNGDGIIDLATFGNYYNREVETTRSDAGMGCLLYGNGDGTFRYIHPSESGFTAFKDARDAILLNANSNNPMIIVANNNETAQLYQLNP